LYWLCVICVLKLTNIAILWQKTYAAGTLKTIIIFVTIRRRLRLVVDEKIIDHIEHCSDSVKRNSGKECPEEPAADGAFRIQKYGRR
jgi:hypothetical protein